MDSGAFLTYFSRWSGAGQETEEAEECYENIKGV